jgi:hypothetical protein
MVKCFVEFTLVDNSTKCKPKLDVEITSALPSLYLSLPPLLVFLSFFLFKDGQMTWRS